MNVIGHHLDLRTGEELPVVQLDTGVISPELGYAWFKCHGANLVIRYSPQQAKILALQRSHDRPVALRFVENPEYIKAFRQMSSNEFKGPRVLPVVAAVGLGPRYQCVMVDVEPFDGIFDE